MNFHDFVDAVEALPGSTGYVFLSPGRHSQSGGAKGLLSAVRRWLAEAGVPRGRFRLIVAQSHDEGPSAELWVVPAGDPPPKPGPPPPDRRCFGPDAVKRMVTRHLGDLTKKAVAMPRPKLPRSQSVRLPDEVRLDVVINVLTGRVEWAQATGGHPLLRQAVIDIACGIRFAPAGPGPEPVYSDGYLVFRFAHSEVE